MDHASKVAAVAAQVRALAGSGEQAHVDKGGEHHVVPLPGDQRFRSRAIDASALCEIVSIDTEALTAVVEPGVTFEALVRATLPHGLAPAVVPELRGITVGGAVAGCSVESLSWSVGGFHDTCLGYEVVTGTGEVLEVSPEQRPDLFHHLHGSYGTLGTITQVTCRLVPAASCVELTYQHHRTFAAFEAAMAEACRVDIEQDHQLVDGIIHAPDHLVLCLGRFTYRPSRAPRTLPISEQYHRSTAELEGDVLHTEDYFFRYDRECHWLTATVPPLTWSVVRRTVGRWFLGSTNLIHWSNRLAPVLQRIKRRPDVVVDVFIPASKLGEFWDWCRSELDFWPLWIVPYRPKDGLYPWIGPGVRDRYDDDMFIDVAVYGAPNRQRGRDISQLMEEEVWRLGGIKTLISRNHYSHERFWQVYDRPAYESAKAQLDPEGLFPDLYDKLGRVD